MEIETNAGAIGHGRVVVGEVECAVRAIRESLDLCVREAVLLQ